MENINMQSVESFIEANRENIIRDITRLVAIPSVSDTTQGAPGAPFGPQVAKAMDTVLEMAEGLGLATHNCEGYMGYADLVGESEKQLACISHVDVVPAGNGWTQDPFTVTLRENCILGRGVADDKGPAVLALYMAKYFIEQGKKLPYTLRLLFGGSEETGMADLMYYKQHYEMPAFCFTPDAEFPVCNGEKGGYNANFTSNKLAGNLLEMNGGLVHNAVCDEATALVKGDAAALKGTERVTVSSENGNIRLVAHGVGAHAAMPETGINAIGLLVDYLLDNKLCSAEEENFLQLLHILFQDPYGKALGIACEDKIFTPLTCVGGMVRFNDGVISQSMDIRFPTSTTGDELAAKLEALAKAHNGELTDREERVPFYISADSDIIKTMIGTYNEITGKNQTPFTMGGGTYARFFPCAVSFGPEETDEKLPSFVGGMHGADEGASLDLLLRALKIYIVSVQRLMQLPL